MSNKKDRNDKKGNCGRGFEPIGFLTLNGRREPYPAKWFTKKAGQDWKAKSLRGSLSGLSKELNIVGLRENPYIPEDYLISTGIMPTNV